MQPLQFKRQSRNSVEVNLTPLIDVVFLLLIFFMVSTSFTREAHLTLTLPEAERSDETSGEDPRVDVIIDADGFYRVGGRMLVDTKLDTLASALQLASEGALEMPIAVTADKNAPYQNVVQVIDIAGQLGFTRVNLTTQPPETMEAINTQL